MTQEKDWLDDAFTAIAIDDDGRACRDIPDSACKEEAGNFFTHAGALSLSKSADALIDPKLVLSWLMTALGAPALAGLLVPIRESGALLPQLFTAGALRRLPRRKWAWAAGAVAQGLGAFMIALAAVTLEGAAAGWAILAALAFLALARSVCSVSYKDVLGKTVDKSRRGRATGLAGSVAAGAAIVFALILTSGFFDRMSLVIAAIILAGLAWVAGGLLFTTLTEEKGAAEGGANAFTAAMDNFSYLRTERQLQRFIATRALLTATALAPPFMVAAGASEGAAYGELGLLVLASAGAGLISSFVWGRLSDKSSRKVLILSATIGAGVLAVAAALAYAGALTGAFLLPVLLFVLMIAYQGVRLGRSTHLVDMASEETRAAFTALSNTVIGIVLIAGGVFSLVASLAGPGAVLAIMAAMCAGAAFTGRGLDEVQAD
ncbi:MAG: MFS transporter [Pseudomonadota bacterium]